MARSDDNAAPVQTAGLLKTSLDKEVRKIERLEEATRSVTRNLPAVVVALLFLAIAGVAAVSSAATPMRWWIIVAAVLGGYMALNIGANDVANNVGPAVGARALTMFGALVIAAIFESAGALIAGGDVVDTISKGIIDPAADAEQPVFVWAMMAALLASALWVNLATISARRSRPPTPSSAACWAPASPRPASAWSTGRRWRAIAASWVISPLLGGIVAAGFLAFIKINIIYQDDKIAAARRWVPVLVAVMAGSLRRLSVDQGPEEDLAAGAAGTRPLVVVAFVAAPGGRKPGSTRQSEGMENRNQSLAAAVPSAADLLGGAALLRPRRERRRQRGRSARRDRHSAEAGDVPPRSRSRSG